MLDIKKDFPIFANHPNMVYLDSGASTQKPQPVIDAVNTFITHDYANIHRGMYDIAEKAEELYHQSKQKVARLLSCKSSEVIYTYNATYGCNLIAQTLVHAGKIKKGDRVMLGIWDHHASIVPRQRLAAIHGFHITYITLDDNYDIDRYDFSQKYSSDVKVVACSHVSNITGKIYDMQKLREQISDDTFFMIDGSQSVPNFPVNVEELDCDCLIFTGHKMMAYTGIGVIYLKKVWIRELEPLIAGGGTIKDVEESGHELLRTAEKFEAGTPNLIGAISLGAVIDYIDTIGGMDAIWQHEQALVSYINQQFIALRDKIKIIGTLEQHKTAVYSFNIIGETHMLQFNEQMSAQNICIRCGGHCAHPLLYHKNETGTCRMSAYAYTTKADIDRFFAVMKDIIS